jgi:2-keto-4-pentenoate hydratase/2-oxohepta-3-ene-1,7-dioic acid hydratase in catechol pathway
MAAFKRLVRFVPKSDQSQILVGQPVSDDIDVGLATRNGEEVAVTVFSGTSVLEAGTPTEKTEIVHHLLSPLTLNEVGSIRCIGLNYRQHAAELSLALPTVPTVFLKPATALAGPYPTPTILPKITQEDDCGDYESELAVILSKAAKNVSEEDALSYVLGYTAANDVSSRTAQFAQSQWTYSKGFDGSCPIGPTLVSPSVIPDPSQLKVRGMKNGEVLQSCGTE